MLAQRARLWLSPERIYFVGSSLTQLSIFPEPNIPVFQYSNIPVVSEAN
jgi:hypothetical protein